MMTENLFSEPVLKDLYFGPLEPFLNCFEGLLLDQGYRRTSIHEKIRVVADFRVWLHQQHVGINELSDRSIDEFIKH